MAETIDEKQEKTSQKEKKKEYIKAAELSGDILYKAESVFPFVLFPDTITISRAKVTIAKRQFFRVAEIISLPHSDILNVECDLGPFFGSLNIYTRVFGTDPLRITFLSRKCAAESKHILEGLIIAHKQGIEIDSFSKEELKKLLRRLDADGPLK